MGVGQERHDYGVELEREIGGHFHVPIPVRTAIIDRILEDYHDVDVGVGFRVPSGTRAK